MQTAAFRNMDLLTIPDNLTLDQIQKLLPVACAKADELATAKKDAELERVDAELAFGQAKEIAMAQADGRDAKTREIQAENMCERHNRAYETSKIEAEFVKDLYKNNNAKIEVLRSLLSAEKTLYEQNKNI